MAIYSGFSTQEVDQARTVKQGGGYGGTGGNGNPPRIVKKFRLTDSQLVTRDLMNALSIRQGDLPGNPTYGTTIWNYVFEPNTNEVRQEMETEIRRVISEDPRIILNSVAVNDYENGVQFELQVAFSPFNQAIALSLNLSKSTGKVTQS